MAETGKALGFFRQRVRWSVWEYLFWAAWLLAYFLPGTNHALLSQVLVWGLFAMSLDIVLGYRGIPSLGHAAFFGIGAYTAGFLGKFGWHEPISGLLIAALLSGLTGLLGRLGLARNDLVNANDGIPIGAQVHSHKSGQLGRGSTQGRIHQRLRLGLQLVA